MGHILYLFPNDIFQEKKLQKKTKTEALRSFLHTLLTPCQTP